MKTRKREIYSFLICVILLTPFIYLAFFCYPIADDLTYAWKGQNSAFWEGILHEYKHWNGRYISNVLVLHNPFGYGSLLAYQLIPIVLIFGIVLSARHFFISIFKNAFTKAHYLVWSFAFTLLFLLSMPNISEGIYWYTGSISYTLGSIFLLLAFSFFKRRKTFLTIIFLFLGMGCSEMCMFVGFSAFLIHSIFSKERKLLILMAAIVFSALVYFAPGNAVRSALFENNHQFWHSFIYSIAQSGRFNLAFFNIVLVIASIAWLYNLNWLNERSLAIRNSFGMNWKSSWLILVFVVFIAAFPAYWSTGILGQHRTINVACFFWILAWFANLTVWYNQLNWAAAYKKYVSAIFVLIMLVAYFITPFQGFQIVEDIIDGRHFVHSNIMHERWKRMENCEKIERSGTIYLPADTSNCKTLDVLPLYEPNHWMNEGYSIFCDCPHLSIVKK